MFFTIRRIGAAVAGGVVAVGLMSGCVSVNPGPTAPSVGVTAPTLPSIPIDTKKSIDEQMAELKTGFAKVYCPVRESELGKAIADEGKRLWNEIAARAQQQGAPVPAFDLDDPKLCQ